MHTPTALIIAGKPYFHYHAYHHLNRDLDLKHTYVACCAESSENKFTCSYFDRSYRINVGHRCSWISINNYPYSRLPTFNILNNNEINESNSSFDCKQSIINCIVTFNSRLGISDRSVNTKEFKIMAFNIFHASNPSSEKELEFNNFLKTINRKVLKDTKINLAQKRRVELCRSLQGKYCNLIMDSGTFGGKSKLIVKVATPVENERHKKELYYKGSETTFLTTSIPSINYSFQTSQIIGSIKNL
jgi:hypothetical protein